MYDSNIRVLWCEIDPKVRRNDVIIDSSEWMCHTTQHTHSSCMQVHFSLFIKLIEGAEKFSIWITSWLLLIFIDYDFNDMIEKLWMRCQLNGIEFFFYTLRFSSFLLWKMLKQKKMWNLLNITNWKKIFLIKSAQDLILISKQLRLMPYSSSVHIPLSSYHHVRSWFFFFFVLLSILTKFECQVWLFKGKV